MSDVTVFLITCRENPNYDDCLKALKNQTIDIKIDIISNYYPMSRAFQEMLNRVKTKFYVQCDEDMILYSNSIEIMLNKIKNVKNNVAMICFPLEDRHVGRKIYGTKIYKSEVFKKYPYNLECISCEIEQMRRLNGDGFINTFADLSECVGEHSPKWNEESIFDRYYDLMDKWKIHKYNWVEKLPALFASRLDDKTNLYALAGALMSLATSDVKNYDKNYLIKNPSYLKVSDWMNEPITSTIYMTNKCNFKCEFCRRQRSDSDIESAPDTDISILIKLLDRYPTIKGVCICGYGEPFMNKDLKSFVEYCNSKNKSTGIITNGSLLYEYSHYFDNTKPSYINISLNASNSEMHEKRSGAKNAWNDIIKGIKSIKDRNIPIYLSFVCDVSSISDISSFIKISNELKVNGSYLHNLLPHEDFDHFSKEVLTVEHKQIIDELKKEDGSNIIVKWPTLIDFSTPRRKCKLQFNMIAIDGNGSISICNSIYPCKKENGNINDSSLWHNDYTKKFRQRFSEPDIPHECKWCFRNWEG